PTADDIDLDDLARRTDGLTPAAINHVVQLGAIDAFKEATNNGHLVQVTNQRLVAALSRHGGEDRPMVEDWTWDSLILPVEVKDELQELQFVIEDPQSARRLGVEPPTGVLLAG